MDEENKLADSIYNIAIAVVGALLIIVLMSSCKTTYIPVESVRMEYRDRLLHDSIHVRDSIYVRERGDTVFMDRWHTEYIDRLRVDSFCKIDSIPVPYPVPYPVEKQLSWWERTKMDIGGVVIWVILLVIVYYGVKLFKTVKTGGWMTLIKWVLGKLRV
jgi:hypothetical protein